MIDVCANYGNKGTNQVFQDEGELIQTLSVTLEQCREICTDLQGCNSFAYCQSSSMPMHLQCNLKTKKYHPNGPNKSVFKSDDSCTTHYKLCNLMDM